MRAIADVVGVITGGLLIFRFFYQNFRSRKSHLEHIRKMEEENKEIDSILNPRIEKEGK